MLYQNHRHTDSKANIPQTGRPLKREVLNQPTNTRSLSSKSIGFPEPLEKPFEDAERTIHLWYKQRSGQCYLDESVRREPTLKERNFRGESTTHDAGNLASKKNDTNSLVSAILNWHKTKSLALMGDLHITGPCNYAGTQQTIEPDRLFQSTKSNTSLSVGSQIGSLIINEWINM